MNKPRTGFTKLGFSKTNFSACSNWNSCSMGKLSCVLEEIDPEAKEYCNCYQRHHKDKIINQEPVFKFKNEDHFVSAIYTANRSTSELQNNESCILKPTRNISACTANVYSLNGCYRGRFHLSDFQIEEPISEKEIELLKNQKLSVNLEVEVLEPLNIEQLSLF